jgi:hypothetical protein
VAPAAAAVRAAVAAVVRAAVAAVAPVAAAVRAAAAVVRAAAAAVRAVVPVAGQVAVLVRAVPVGPAIAVGPAVGPAVATRERLPVRVAPLPPALQLVHRRQPRAQSPVVRLELQGLRLRRVSAATVQRRRAVRQPE